MDALKALRTRCSVRQYADDPVAADLVDQVVDAGRLAATGMNVQPWEFVVVTDPAVRAKLAAVGENAKTLAGVPVCVVVFCKDTRYFVEDGSAATQNMLVAARALGLDSCWIAGDKKPYADTVAGLLSVPEGYKLVSMVAVGYAKERPARASKRPLAEVIHRERFGGT